MAPKSSEETRGFFSPPRLSLTWLGILRRTVVVVVVVAVVVVVLEEEEEKKEEALPPAAAKANREGVLTLCVIRRWLLE